MEKESYDMFIEWIAKDEEIIWKYMSFEKFLLFLKNKELYFKRADRFMEYFEGYIPKEEKQILFRKFSNNNEENAVRNIKTAVNFFTKCLESTYIDCWHNSNEESFAMWKVFGSGNNCIAIKSSVGKLKSIYSKNKLNLNIAPYYVDYYNPESSKSWTYSSKYVFLRKPIYFNYEKEIRGLIHFYPNSIWEEFPDNIAIPFSNITCFIDAIYVSPFSDDGFSEIVVDIVKKYGVDDINIFDSKLNFEKINKNEI